MKAGYTQELIQRLSPALTKRQIHQIEHADSQEAVERILGGSEDPFRR